MFLSSISPLFCKARNQHWLLVGYVKQTLEGKKTLLIIGLSYLECTQEAQMTFRGPLGRPSKTMSSMYTAFRAPFSTRIAPTSPKSTGISILVSYLILRSPFINNGPVLLLFAYTLIVSLSSPVSTNKTVRSTLINNIATFFGCTV